MGVRGIGHEVISLERPGPVGIVDALEVARRGRVVDMDAILVNVVVEIVSQLIHILKPHVRVSIIEVLTHSHDQVGCCVAFCLQLRVVHELSNLRKKI